MICIAYIIQLNQNHENFCYFVFLYTCVCEQVSLCDNFQKKNQMYFSIEYLINLWSVENKEISLLYIIYHKYCTRKNYKDILNVNVKWKFSHILFWWLCCNFIMRGSSLLKRPDLYILSISQSVLPSILSCSMFDFYASGLKGPLETSSYRIVRPSFCLSVRLSVSSSVRLTNKVQYSKFWWRYSNQTWTVSSSKGSSHFTDITCPWGWAGSKCRT